MSREDEIMMNFIEAYFEQFVNFIMANELQFKGKTAEETANIILKGKDK
jgi:hypothetical protein